MEANILSSQSLWSTLNVASPVVKVVIIVVTATIAQLSQRGLSPGTACL